MAVGVCWLLVALSADVLCSLISIVIILSFTVIDRHRSHYHLVQVDADEKEEADKKQAAEQEPAAESESSEDQPATLKKAQDAAAARKDGEEVGSSGKHTIHVPPVICSVTGTCCSWLVICQMGVEQHDSFCGMQVLIP